MRKFLLPFNYFPNTFAFFTKCSAKFPAMFHQLYRLQLRNARVTSLILQSGLANIYMLVGRFEFIFVESSNIIKHNESIECFSNSIYNHIISCKHIYSDYIDL